MGEPTATEFVDQTCEQLRKAGYRSLAAILAATNPDNDFTYVGGVPDIDFFVDTVVKDSVERAMTSLDVTLNDAIALLKKTFREIYKEDTGSEYKDPGDSF